MSGTAESGGLPCHVHVPQINLDAQYLISFMLLKEVTIMARGGRYDDPQLTRNAFSPSACLDLWKLSFMSYMLYNV